MLVVGQYPMHYRPLAPAEDWDRCQRYYEIIGSVSFYFNAANASWHLTPLGFTAKKQSSPTCTFTGGVTANMASIGINGYSTRHANVGGIPSGAGYSTIQSATLTAEVT
jgi:hypothetical protein